MLTLEKIVKFEAQYDDVSFICGATIQVVYSTFELFVDRISGITDCFWVT